MRLARILAIALLVFAVLVPASAAIGGTTVGRYIVVLNPSVSNPGAVANEHAQRYGADVRYVYRYALKGFAATIPNDRLDAVRSDPRVAYVSVDAEVHALGQTLPTGINRIDGDVSSQHSGNGSGSVSNVAVAVIDTGSGPHSDLNVVGGKNCSTGNSYNDGNGHGTHVAGTIGAKDDGSGVVGVAPGVPIYSVRVLNNAGSGSWSSVACGIDWVTGHWNDNRSAPIKVASMSLGGSGSDGACSNSALHQAICNSVAAGITYVVAAGNSNANFSGFVPAAYDQVLTVTAMADFNGQPGGGAPATCRSDVDDTYADFSNYAGSGDSGHTIAGPGVCIYSTWKGGGYNTISGTSMATPHVSGTVALCIAAGQCTVTTPSIVIGKIRNTNSSYGFAGDPNNPTGSRYYGYLDYAGGF
jgi:subtilisin